MFSRRGRWPSSQRVVRHTVNVPDPLTVEAVAALDANAVAGMNSHAGSILSGLSSSMHYKFTGYLRRAPGDAGVPIQAATPSLLRRPSTLLPATSGPVIPGSRTVADVLRGES